MDGRTLRVSMSCAGVGRVLTCNRRRYCRLRLLLGEDKRIKEINSAVLQDEPSAKATCGLWLLLRLRAFHKEDRALVYAPRVCF